LIGFIRNILRLSLCVTKVENKRNTAGDAQSGIRPQNNKGYVQELARIFTYETKNGDSASAKARRVGLDYIQNAPV
jgi:hypothetical protein